MKERQEIGRKKRYRYHVILNLEEDEKKVLDGMAEAFGANGRTRKGLSQATLELLRIGVNCIRYHPLEEEAEPQRLTINEALELGLTVPGASRQRNTLYRDEEEC